MSGYTGEELQSAAWIALDADVTLSALVTGIFNYIPSNTTFPYIIIEQVGSQAFDDKTVSGAETFLNIHSYSQGQDQRTIHKIHKAVHDVLHRAALSVTGQTLITLNWDNLATVIRDNTDNMKTFHGVMRFRALTQSL